MGQRVYADNFSISYSEPGGFLDFLKERSQNARWVRYQANELAYAVSTPDIEPDPLCGSYTAEELKDILEDTSLHTKLVLETQYGGLPVRECALRSILRRANISGTALNKVKKPIFAEILNYCMEVTKGNALIYVADGKVSAVHSGDENGYAVLEVSQLLQKVLEYLDSHFPRNKFIGGYYDHSIVTAQWELPDEHGLVHDYQELLEQYGMDSEDIVPALRFCCSDVAISGANLSPMLLMGPSRKTLRLGRTLGLRHRGKTQLDEFDEQLEMLFPQFERALKDLTKMLEVIISHPVNCMREVCKKLALPKKLAYPAIETFRAKNGESCCTAYEIYCAICEITYNMQCDGEPDGKIVQMEETISRAIYIHWQDYDFGV